MLGGVGVVTPGCAELLQQSQEGRPHLHLGRRLQNEAMRIGVCKVEVSFCSARSSDSSKWNAMGHSENILLLE